MSQWPPAFEASLRAQLGDEAQQLFEALDTEPIVSVRVNPAKPTDKFTTCAPVPWAAGAYYLPERPQFTLDPLLHAGAYYVQEASSMAIHTAFRHFFGDASNVRALDLCAAPGGKSTLLASLVGAEGLLVANEVIASRASILRENLAKWGQANTIVTNNDPRDFYPFAGFFDCVAVDAPCSGEGLFRRDSRAAEQWSTDNVNLCAGRQKRILADAMALIRPGGLLLYSTCTWEPAENEEIAQWLHEQGYQAVALPADKLLGAVQTEGGGFRFYPHRVQGEGFYLLAMQKPGEAITTDVQPKRKSNWQPVGRNVLSLLQPWLQAPETFECWQKEDEVVALPSALASSMLAVADRLKIRHWGIPMGKLIRDKLVPAHELAMSIHIAKAIPAVELSESNALSYLRKQHLSPSVANGKTGWLLMQYQGQNLGFVKALPNRLNNYYPKEWRIRMQ